MTPSSRHRHRPLALAAGAGALAMALAGAPALDGAPGVRRLPFAAALTRGSLHAQAVGGVGEDAVPIPAGRFRITLGGAWREGDERFVVDNGERTRVPWLHALQLPALDGSVLPALAQPQAALRTLTGDASASLSIGALDADGIERQSTSLLQLEYGVTRRVGVFATVPYVDVRQSVQLRVNDGGTTATAGPSTAGGANAATYTQLEAARATLAGAIADCPAVDPPSAICQAIAANPAAASTLAQRTQELRDAWGVLYGGAAATASPVIPVAGSAQEAAVNATLAALASSYAAYGITDVPDAVPAGATQVYGPGSLSTLVEDGLLGVASRTPQRRYRAGFGDISIGTSVLLFDSWGANQRARLTTDRPGARVLAQVGWRFGSANLPPSDRPFAVATGDGAGALLARVTADLVWTRRAWLSVTTRLVQPQADEVIVRYPRIGDPAAFLNTAPVAVSRELGRTLSLELAPRYAISDAFGFSAAYRLTRTAGARFAPLGDADAMLPTALTTPDVSVHQASIGVMYSTLAPFIRRTSSIPIDVLFARDMTLGAGSGPAPVYTQDRLELRIYTAFPRR